MRCISCTQGYMVRKLQYTLFSIHLIVAPTRFFNDTELKNSPKHKIEAKQNVFSLTVNKCDHPDVGTYSVKVDNGIDHTEQTAKLNVGGTFSSFSNTPKKFPHFS